MLEGALTEVDALAHEGDSEIPGLSDVDQIALPVISSTIARVCCVLSTAGVRVCQDSQIAPPQDISRWRQGQRMIALSPP